MVKCFGDEVVRSQHGFAAQSRRLQTVTPDPREAAFDSHTCSFVASPLMRRLRVISRARPSTSTTILRSMSSSANSSKNTTATRDMSESTSGQLAIEEAASSTTELKIGGDSVKLESLGPIVINADGTMSRLNNWHEMTEPEKCATKRMILKRNEKRRQVLLEQGIKVGQSVSN